MLVVNGAHDPVKTIEPANHMGETDQTIAPGSIALCAAAGKAKVVAHMSQKLKQKNAASK